MKKIRFKPIWFDSLGAKSSCTLVWTRDVKILIDPGAAIMQPSFPANPLKKLYWLVRAKLNIQKAAKSADIVIISHYHYDHFTDFDRKLYERKTLLVKNPNEFINESQRKRAEKFFEHLCQSFGRNNRELEEIAETNVINYYFDVYRNLGRKFPRGFRWFKKLCEKWKSWYRIPELDFSSEKVKFAEDKTFKFGKTKIQMSKPFFHGIEFSKVGWVFSTVIQYCGEKLIHSSDINGPVIEEYANWIIDHKPNVLILDGPSTYMLGYLIPKSNLLRAVKNAKRIVKETSLELLIYDHHLVRDPKFRELTSEVWEICAREGVKILTAAEFLGRKPVVSS